jgi:hypothetical protein
MGNEGSKEDIDSDDDCNIKENHMCESFNHGSMEDLQDI